MSALDQVWKLYAEETRRVSEMGEAWKASDSAPRYSPTVCLVQIEPKLPQRPNTLGWKPGESLFALGPSERISQGLAGGILSRLLCGKEGRSRP